MYSHLIESVEKWYSQTCSNDHLYKTTNAESAQEIPIQSLLYKTTTCLTRPATTFFFISQMKKKPAYNTHYKTLPSEEMGNKHKAAMHNIIFTLL